MFQAGKTVQNHLPSTNSQEDPGEEKDATEKDATEAKRQGQIALDAEQIADQMGVMFHEYDLMFHYLLASLRRADGAKSVTESYLTYLLGLGNTGKRLVHITS